jgi:hypothetical protein
MSNKSSSGSGPTKISTFILAAIYVTIVLAVVAIAVGAITLNENTEVSIQEGIVLIIIGFIAMALAGYIMFQSRKRVATLKIEAPPILTTIECKKCGIKSVREFQRGDYVYKELEKCQKCDDKQIITAIYREVKEKEKPIKV